jgi:putative DNA primase/helicase
LSEFAPSHKLLQIANVPYNAEAKCPLFHSFIKHIFNEDKELIDFVQVLCGYLFTGLTWEQKLFILYGLGSNGKSLFVSILLHIAGDYGISTPSNTLLENGSSGIRNDLARLRNRRIVAASETNLGKRFDEAGIKILTGEDKIVCRKLYSDYFEYSTQYKVLLTVNNLPRIRGNDKGIKRRICIIPFNVTFENNKCDKELKEKLLKESEGIFAWIIEGSKRYFKNGLLECQAVINATANYLNEMDTIQTFLGDMCRVDANNKKLKIPVKTLYSCYETWAKENCLEPVGKYNFGESIKEKGIVQGKSGSVRYWQGVIIRR